MKLRDIKRDRGRSEGGVWWNFETSERLNEPHETELCVRVAEAENPKYRDALARIGLARHAELRRANGSAGAVMESIKDEALAAAILVDWRNMHDDETGEVVPYSPEKAAAILADPSLWPFRQFVLDVARSFLSYRQEAEEKALGN